MREYQARKREQRQENVKNVTEACKEVVLSDGQAWIPDPQLEISEANINYMGELRGDLAERKARAERYTRWLEAGKPVGDVSGGIMANKPVIEYLAQNLNPSYYESVRVGLSGPSLADLKPVIAQL
jgi:hypothetical protein